MFDATVQKIAKVLGDRDTFYKIPQYQREYSWNDDLVIELLDDIYKAWDKSQDNEDPNDHYFMGSIVLIKPTKDNDPFEVVDGQQRLITLIIMMCVLRDLKKKGKIKIDEESIGFDGDIDELIVKKTRERLIPYANQYLLFKNIVEDNVIDWNTIDKDKNSLPNKQQRESDKFYNTARVFIKKFIGEDEDDECLFKADSQKITSFLNYLLNKTRMIVITCEDQEKAIKIFQTLNATGLDLTIDELIKSFLFNEIKGNGRDDKIEGLSRIWDELANEIKDQEINLDNALLYYAYYLNKGDLDQNLYKYLTDEKQIFAKYAKKDPIGTSSEFAKFTYCYQTISDKNRDVFLLKMLRQTIYWRTILMSAAYIENPKCNWEELAIYTMRFYYLFLIAGDTITPIKGTSFEIIKAVAGGKSLYEIKEIMENKIKDRNVIKRVWENIRKENVYNENWCKPLLVGIETKHTDGTGFIRNDVGNLHIEHIFPQNPADINDWKGLSDKEDKLHSLANLTLLSGRKNKAASNSAFNKKLEKYEGTEIMITQKLAGYKSDGWIDKSYDHRKNWMEEQIAEIFKIPLLK